MSFHAPDIDYAGIAPILALSAGTCVVLLAGVFRTPRWALAALALVTLAAAAGLEIWQWTDNQDLVAGALRHDELAMAGGAIAIFSAAAAVLLSFREPAADRAGLGEFYALLLASTLGMVIFTQAINLVTFFVGLELLSIPLYVLCASDVRREGSLEAGLKYLVIGSLGSATLLYGLSLLYGGGGSTDFDAISTALQGGNANDTLVLIGTAMAAAGLAFKISLAPFHQWTPDVYQGAPTPVTAFMAVATKAAAFIAVIHLFEVALAPLADDWKPALAALAVASIAVGNIGALGQDSLKRLMGYSSVAQAGYMLAGVVVFSETGRSALVFYLAAYALMSFAVFAVIVARERETGRGDDISAVEGIGSTRPLLAWPLTIGMLALAGLPGTAGFMGKLYLIEACVEGDYTWLGVAIVIGAMVSLAYYLRVVAAIWMTSSAASSAAPAAAAFSEGGPAPIAGGAPEGDVRGTGRCILIWGTAVFCAAATVFFGVIPSPLVDWATNVGASLAFH